jgi:hypothetical protein
MPKSFVTAEENAPRIESNRPEPFAEKLKEHAIPKIDATAHRHSAGIDWNPWAPCAELREENAISKKCAAASTPSVRTIWCKIEDKLAEKDLEDATWAVSVTETPLSAEIPPNSPMATCAMTPTLARPTMRVSMESARVLSSVSAAATASLTTLRPVMMATGWLVTVARPPANSKMIKVQARCSLGI